MNLKLDFFGIHLLTTKAVKQIERNEKKKKIINIFANRVKCDEIFHVNKSDRNSSFLVYLPSLCAENISQFFAI